jgi:hypothetical protein
MACSALPRGTRQAAPHTGPPFNDYSDNNPCGKPHITTINGVAVADGLCLPHYALKNGLAAITAPLVFAP